jgi:hypothetical protein
MLYRPSQIIAVAAVAVIFAIVAPVVHAGSMDQYLSQALTSTSALAVTWEDCGVNADAKISSLTPDTIQLGATTDFTGGGDLSKDVTGGTWQMTMTGVGGVSLLKCNGDAATPAKCNIGLGPFKVGTASYGGVQLPVKKGHTSLPKIVSVQLPAGLPNFALKTTTTLTVTDQDGTEAFCAKISTAPKSGQLETTASVEPIVDSEDSWKHEETTGVSMTAAKCTGSSTLPGNGPFCFHASIGMLGVKENLDLKVVRTAGEFAVVNGEAQITTEKGQMSLVGSGVSPFKCSGVDITKDGQSVSPDMDALKKCLPRGVSVNSVKYCSDTNTVQITISDSNIPVVGKSITKQAQSVKCPSQLQSPM